MPRDCAERTPVKPKFSNKINGQLFEISEPTIAVEAKDFHARNFKMLPVMQTIAEE